MPALADGGFPPAGGGGARDLRLRIASASVLAAVGLGALAAGGVLWALLVLLCVGLAAAEWSRMWRLPSSTRASLVGAAVAASLLAALGHPGAGLAVGVLLAAGAAMARERVLAAGLVYVVVPGVSLLFLRDHHEGFPLVLRVLLVVWASDTGAFFAGRRFGGRRLAPLLSPNKTWSGAAGGLLAAIAMGALAAAFFPHRHIGGGMAVGAILSVAAQAGDLLESAAKRRAGVKDSGRLIPGHGGLLDRVDGLIAAAPVAALLAVLR